ncbi:hypothetical protein DPMN_042211 [Dreissena polymorpha]|uniref:Uncharacterized protein n=1 Tax=Dreissena polymorpha TaxID=45954 RepID=A0A9D4CY93_DREPO|nr:hypothetical protein DPMN_042211 [Dreissena polymorpha]
MCIHLADKTKWWGWHVSYDELEVLGEKTGAAKIDQSPLKGYDEDNTTNYRNTKDRALQRQSLDRLVVIRISARPHNITIIQTSEVTKTYTFKLELKNKRITKKPRIKLDIEKIKYREIAKAFEARGKFATFDHPRPQDSMTTYQKADRDLRKKMKEAKEECLEEQCNLIDKNEDHIQQ